MRREVAGVGWTLCSFFLFAVALGGCGLLGADAFTAGLRKDTCDGNINICTTSAGCTMGAGRYIEGSFPGTRRFIVTTPGESTIRLLFFFTRKGATGTDTTITWFEPGCFERYVYRSGGRDIFREAGVDQVFEQAHRVYEAGDHLIEVFSDADADYLLKVEIDTL